jgi:hypothetical protein
MPGFPRLPPGFPAWFSRLFSDGETDVEMTDETDVEITVETDVETDVATDGPPSRPVMRAREG